MSLLPTPRSGHAPTNGLELAYEDYGDTAAPAVVMIMGLGTQLLGWPEPLIAALLERGFRVVRFDNRDVGLSTRLSGAKPTEDIRRAYSKSLLGLPVQAPYRLQDMAQDTLGLLDALQIERAHVVGASMGAMIGQTLAGHHADRVASLTSIMSSSGYRWLRPGDPRATLRLSQPPPAQDPETIARHMTQTMRVIGSKPHLAMDDDQRYAELKRAAERAYYPAGTARQLLAILASGSRVDLLRRLRTPTLVLHGEHDPLVPVTHGRHTARCIPKARLETFDGMGHDLPPALMPRFAALIAEHAAQVGR
ncbi:alpha/beta hydrolase [Algiphilus sp.]|uniref:alpha/beta fold hydrolase n=1 Tax=Algiphilus sp. TaxID=1872431 RepID=UPI0032EF0777